MHLGRNNLLGALLLVAALTALATPVAAQEGGPPPFPIIYDGQVFLDGTLIGEGTLTARVGDWVSVEIPVVDGAFRCASCLILGPPSFSYVGQQVTFHLAGHAEPASFAFEFPALGQPERDTIDLFFGDVPATRTTSFWVWVVGGGMGVLVLLSFGLWRMLMRPAGGTP